VVHEENVFFIDCCVQGTRLHNSESLILSNKLNVVINRLYRDIPVMGPEN